MVNLATEGCPPVTHSSGEIIWRVHNVPYAARRILLYDNHDDMTAIEWIVSQVVKSNISLSSRFIRIEERHTL